MKHFLLSILFIVSTCIYGCSGKDLYSHFTKKRPVCKVLPNTHGYFFVTFVWQISLQKQGRTANHLRRIIVVDRRGRGFPLDMKKRKGIHEKDSNLMTSSQSFSFQFCLHFLKEQRVVFHRFPAIFFMV